MAWLASGCGLAAFGLLAGGATLFEVMGTEASARQALQPMVHWQAASFPLLGVALAISFWCQGRKKPFPATAAAVARFHVAVAALFMLPATSWMLGLWFAGSCAAYLAVLAGFAALSFPRINGSWLPGIRVSAPRG